MAFIEMIRSKHIQWELLFKAALGFAAATFTVFGGIATFAGKTPNFEAGLLIAGAGAIAGILFASLNSRRPS